jgi:hypothetical protein
MVRFFIILILCCAAYHLQAARFTWVWNKNVETAYQKISSLQTSQGSALILAEVDANASNAYPILLANYIDFYDLFFNESQDKYNKYLKKVDQRLKLITQSDETNAMHKHAMATIKLQTALIGVKCKDNFAAAKSLRSAYKMFQENKKAFPQFIEGDAALGAIQMAVASLPSGYKWVANLFGISENGAEGRALIQNSISQKKGLFTDRLFLYVYTYQFLLNDKEAALKALEPYQSAAPADRLLSFMLANIALNQSRSADAEKIILANINIPGFMDVPILHYELGTAYMNRWSNKCIPEFLKYLKQYKGSFYVKDTYYKMAMYYYCNGDKENYEKYVNEILNQGASESDADKSATKYAQEKYPLNIALLKARFYNDGGYQKEAIALLNKENIPADFVLENYYRRGKIWHDSKQIDSANYYYRKAAVLGANNKRYFAAKALLSLGQIQEDAGNKIAAAKFYKECIALENHEAETSLEQKAKAGLLRCK